MSNIEQNIDMEQIKNEFEGFCVDNDYENIKTLFEKQYEHDIYKTGYTKLAIHY